MTGLGALAVAVAGASAATAEDSAYDPAALVAQIRNCLNMPPGAAEAGAKVQLEFEIDADGMPSKPVVVGTPSTPHEQALAGAAQRAVMRCGPYTMAAGQTISAVFDSSAF